MRKALRLGLQLVEPAFERELPVNRADFIRECGDGSPVEVEAAVGVAARGEEQQRAPARPVLLVLVDLHLLAGHGREHHEGGRKLVAALVFGERALEVAEPGPPAGHWSSSQSASPAMDAASSSAPSAPASGSRSTSMSSSSSRSAGSASPSPVASKTYTSSVE